jgi:hypothetical protein
MSVRTIRNRHDSLQRDVDRDEGVDPEGSSAMLVVTFTQTTYPVAALSTYACHPVTINGGETEGATPTYIPDTTITLYAVNLGTTIPPPGSYLVVSGAGGRWTFRYDI